jgi:hypothetical protein
MQLLLMYYLIFVGIFHLMRILVVISRSTWRMLEEGSIDGDEMLRRMSLRLWVGLLTFRTLCSRLLRSQISSLVRIIS